VAGCDIIVIGGSAGGLEAIRELAPLLPADLPAAVFVTLHVYPGSDGILPLLIERAVTAPGLPSRGWRANPRGPDLSMPESATRGLSVSDRRNVPDGVVMRVPGNGSESFQPK
jgi:hypothetical protein